MDRAEQIFCQIDQLLNRVLGEDLSLAEREQIYRYLEDLHTAWDRLCGDRHTCRNIREQCGGSWLGPGGFPEQIGVYCNDQYRNFIELAETTGRLVEEMNSGQGGQLESGGWGSGGPYQVQDAGPLQMTASDDLGISSQIGVGGGDDSWVTDPSAVLERYESDPEGFYQAFKEMSEEDRMLAMFSLQRAAQLNAQLMQLVSNLLQVYHDTSMAVVRNLRA
ncbi:MAG: hypothetical protein JW797_12160 [Bradymonadales bacterium]|nr:hypothetical protein [Bradymonadales bacterium]